MSGAYELIVIGCSWGGLQALTEVLAWLPEDYCVPVVVAQHRAIDAHEGMMTSLLQHHSTLELVEPNDKDTIQAGRIYIAPPDYHLLVEDHEFALSTEAEVHHSRPSIDVLFESAADAFGDRVAGVILTGANDDGAAGLATIRQRGGLTIVQDPATAERPEMPEAAIATGAAIKVLALKDIGPFLANMCGGP